MGHNATHPDRSHPPTRWRPSPSFRDTIELIPESDFVLDLLRLLRQPPPSAFARPLHIPALDDTARSRGDFNNRRVWARNSYARGGPRSRRGGRHSEGNIVPPLSPIDALASVAAQATHSILLPAHRTQQADPSAVVMPFGSTFAQSDPQADYESQFQHDDRATKRARSEITFPPPLSSPQLEVRSRPATSYNGSNGWIYDAGMSFNNNRQSFVDSEEPKMSGNSQSASPDEEKKRVSDAELLLGFFRGAKSSSSQPSSSATKEDMDIKSSGPRHWLQLPPRSASQALQDIRTSRESQNLNHPTQFQEVKPKPEEGARSLTKLSSQGPRTPADCSTDSQGLGSNSRTNNMPHSEKTLPEAAELLPQQEKKTEYVHDSKQLPAMRSGHMAVQPQSQMRMQAPSSPAIDINDGQSVVFGDAMSEFPSLYQSTEAASTIPSTHVTNTTSSDYLSANEQLASNHSDPGRSVVQRPLSHVVQKKKSHQIDEVTKCAGCAWSPNSFAAGEYVDWLQCNGCKLWFHLACAGFTLRDVRKIDKFYCRNCQSKYGKTTFVRKSSRAHTSVDYAGLNEGVLRTSDETPEHHYIKPIRDGIVKFLPESFPRMAPEEVTAEFFERCPSISEPVVIPQHLNPSPWRVDSTGDHELSDDAIPQRCSSIEHSGYMQEATADDGQDKLEMVIPSGLTVRQVAEIHGHEMPLEVIDVKSQEGDSSKKWNLGKWVDYYESTGEKVIRNVISLEVSRSPLGRLIRRPKIVRDLDLQDSVWPDSDERRISVGFYCLMSVANSYTDFHIDFGGSSVYYHILRGKKTFLFIPPTRQNLKKYEDWCRNRAQNSIFLPDSTKECYRVDLEPGDTMLIPSGWIHAVWTPEDSLVIGGNFLTRLHYSMQIRIAEIERNCKVATKYRYPYFQKVLWYAVLQYLEHDPLPDCVRQVLFAGQQFLREVPTYLESDAVEQESDSHPETYHARYYPKAELDGLPDLVSYIFRTVMIYLDRLEGIGQESRKAVVRSIPKQAGEPVKLAKEFAVWVAWKRGNEYLPQWAHPNGNGLVPLKNDEEGPKAKRVTAAEMKKLEKLCPVHEFLSAGGSQTEPTLRDGEAFVEDIDFPETIANSGTVMVASTSSTPKTSVLGPRRTACDVCRKRKMRCKHMGDLVNVSPKQPINVTSSGRPLYLSAASDEPDLASQANASGSGSTSRRESDGQDDSPDGKKGRNKACQECRRSKRRCIHDENGNIDPIKLAEPAVSRGSAAGKKRKSSGTGEADHANKKYKADTNFGHTPDAYGEDAELSDSPDIQEKPSGVMDPMLLNPSPAEQKVDDLANQRPDDGNDIQTVGTNPTNGVANSKDSIRPEGSPLTRRDSVSQNGRFVGFEGDITVRKFGNSISADDSAGRHAGLKSQSCFDEEPDGEPCNSMRYADGVVHFDGGPTSPISQRREPFAHDPLNGIHKTTPAKIDVHPRQVSYKSASPGTSPLDGLPGSDPPVKRRRQSSRDSKPVERFRSDGSNKRTQRSGDRVSSAGPKSGSPPRTSNLSASLGTPAPKTSPSNKKPTATSRSPTAPAFETKEDASWKLAMELQASQFGLRRRS